MVDSDTISVFFASSKMKVDFSKENVVIFLGFLSIRKVSGCNEMLVRKVIIILS